MRLSPSPSSYQSVYERFIEIPHAWTVKLKQWDSISDDQVSTLKHDIGDAIKMRVDKLQLVYFPHDPEQMLVLFMNNGVHDVTKFIALRQSACKSGNDCEQPWYLQVFLGDPGPVYKTGHFTINTDPPVDGGWNLHVLTRRRVVVYAIDGYRELIGL
jgi:hypothetical protein